MGRHDHGLVLLRTEATTVQSSLLQAEDPAFLSTPVRDSYFDYDWLVHELDTEVPFRFGQNETIARTGF